MKEKKYITTKEAIDLIKEISQRTITKTTVYKWIRRYNIGYRMGGRWMINKKLLTKFIKGE